MSEATAGDLAKAREIRLAIEKSGRYGIMGRIEILKALHETLTSEREFAFDDFESDYTIAASKDISILLNALPALLKLAEAAKATIANYEKASESENDDTANTYINARAAVDAAKILEVGE